MNTFFMILAAFVAGLAASLGIGGGMILMIFLTVFGGYSQLEAQGLNLLFFLPIAITSVILHSKNHLIDKKVIYPTVVTGVIGAVAGTLLAHYIANENMRLLFAAFLLFVGISEVVKSFRKTHDSPDDS